MSKWPSEVFDDKASPVRWREPTEQERRALVLCARTSGECALGHLQVLSIECDGVHCHRACDEVAREGCRQTWERQ